MSTLLKIVLAVVVGLFVTGFLEYFGVLNRTLDVLLGFVAALLVYFNA